MILLAGTKVGEVPEEQLECYEKAIIFLNEFMRNNSLVLLDTNGMVLREYKNSFSISSYPNNATIFFQYAMVHAEYMDLTEVGEAEFQPYPEDADLQNFDPPDRKFIALAYGHPKHPPIIEASDSKWWGIRKIIKANHMTVIFIDEEYIKSKYQKKMSN